MNFYQPPFYVYLAIQLLTDGEPWKRACRAKQQLVAASTWAGVSTILDMLRSGVGSAEGAFTDEGGTAADGWFRCLCAADSIAMRFDASKPYEAPAIA
jgi:hypothetical protein